jgi:hypothetical protein
MSIRGHAMVSDLRQFSPILFIVLILAPSLLAGCLGNGNNEEDKGVSALAQWTMAEKERETYIGEFTPVVVTALDPTSKGNSLSWKFAYNDLTPGIADRSLLVTVDEEDTATSEIDDPLSKSPIRNWTVDSTTAYSKARTEMIDQGIITSNVKIKVQFFYLLGEAPGNNGCEWSVGLILGSEHPLEATIRVDGRYGNVIEIIDSKI